MKTIEVLVSNSWGWRDLEVGTILRVNDRAAKTFVDDNDAKYVPKSEWKKQEDKLKAPTQGEEQ